MIKHSNSTVSVSYVHTLENIRAVTIKLSEVTTMVGIEIS